jgi:septal ring factor EnvC (AmiA/AmiB activator)
MFHGTAIFASATGLPRAVGFAVACFLLPTTLVLSLGLALKAFSPKFRKWAAISFLSLAALSAVYAAAVKHKDDVAPIFQSVLVPIQKWQAARHDKKMAELAHENESAKQALQTQEKQLQMADAALSAEKTARLHDQQVFLERLSTQLSDGQKTLTAAMAKMENPSLQSLVAANQRLAEASNALASAMTNGSLDLPSLQMIVEGAVSNSAEAQLEIQVAAAAAAAKQSALAAAAAQSALEEKGRKEAGQSQQLADEQQAQAKIQAAVDAQEKANAVALALAQEKAALEAKAAKLQKLADERQQQAQADQQHQSDPAAAPQNQPQERQSQNQSGLRKRIRHWLGEDSGVTVTIQNTTGYTLYITFSSPRWQHIWPAEGRAFVAEPGGLATINLRGFPGEPVFYKAWAAQNPNIQWGGDCDCGPSGQPSPIAICGDDDPPLLRLVLN